MSPPLHTVSARRKQDGGCAKIDLKQAAGSHDRIELTWHAFAVGGVRRRWVRRFEEMGYLQGPWVAEGGPQEAPRL